MRKPFFGVSGFPNRSDTNWAVQPQKTERGLKSLFRKKMYNENKGADQLRSYCTANFRFCFRMCKIRSKFLVTW